MEIVMVKNIDILYILKYKILAITNFYQVLEFFMTTYEDIIIIYFNLIDVGVLSNTVIKHSIVIVTLLTD